MWCKRFLIFQFVVRSQGGAIWSSNWGINLLQHCANPRIFATSWTLSGWGQCSRSWCFDMAGQFPLEHGTIPTNLKQLGKILLDAPVEEQIGGWKVGKRIYRSWVCCNKNEVFNYELQFWILSGWCSSVSGIFGQCALSAFLRRKIRPAQGRNWKPKWIWIYVS